jgi:hypothetical protein
MAIALFATGCAILSPALRGQTTRPIPAPAVEGGYLKLDFYWLANFPFVLPESKTATGEEQIPATVKSWSGKKAILTGFMLPLVFKDGKSTELLLMANLMLCCYGTVPKMNDWVIVRVPGGTEVIQDQPIRFQGLFHVGAFFDNGFLSGIYQLDAEGPGVLQQ